MDRVKQEHNYSLVTSTADIDAVSSERNLPLWLQMFGLQPDQAVAGSSMTVPDLAAQDGVFNYAAAVLTDGLLLKQFRDAIHEGDGNRVQLCYKFILPYYYSTGHTKYANEAFHYLSSLMMDEVSSSSIATQIKWSRFVNTHGKEGFNIPADLHMEHLNRHLKRLITGLGANCSSAAIVNISKCIHRLLGFTSSLDKALNLQPEQTHHSQRSSEADEKLIMTELVTKTHVFDYSPGRQHRACHVTSSVLQSLNADAYIGWLHKQKVKLIADHKFKQLLA